MRREAAVPSASESLQHNSAMLEAQLCHSGLSLPLPCAQPEASSPAGLQPPDPAPALPCTAPLQATTRLCPRWARTAASSAATSALRACRWARASPLKRTSLPASTASGVSHAGVCCRASSWPHSRGRRRHPALLRLLQHVTMCCRGLHAMHRVGVGRSGLGRPASLHTRRLRVRAGRDVPRPCRALPCRRSAGFTCTRAELSEDIKQLYQTGLFESVNARVLPQKKGKFKVRSLRRYRCAPSPLLVNAVCSE